MYARTHARIKHIQFSFRTIHFLYAMTFVEIWMYIFIRKRTHLLSLHGLCIHFPLCVCVCMYVFMLYIFVSVHHSPCTLFTALHSSMSCVCISSTPIHSFTWTVGWSVFACRSRLVHTTIENRANMKEKWSNENTGFRREIHHNTCVVFM